MTSAHQASVVSHSVLVYHLFYNVYSSLASEVMFLFPCWKKVETKKGKNELQTHM
jgi:hypothetical protein